MPSFEIHLVSAVVEKVEKKDVADRWKIAEEFFLPKEENLEKLGQFRPISLLNIVKKIISGIIA